MHNDNAAGLPVLLRLSVPLLLGACLDTVPPDSMVEASEFAAGSNDAIATSFSEGMIHAAGETLGIFLENVDTGGSLESARRMVSGSAPLGLVQEDVLRYARDEYLRQYLSDPATADRDLLAIASQLRVIMVGYHKQLFLVVNTNVAETLADLRTSTTPVSLNVGALDSETYLTATSVVDAHVFATPPLLETHDAARGIELVLDGTLDGAFLVADHPSDTLMAIPAGSPVTLAKVTMPEGRKLYAETGTVFADDYAFHGSHIHSNLTVQNVLVAGPMLSDRAIDVFIDYVLDHAADYEAFDPHWREVSLAKSLDFMLGHPQQCNLRALYHVAGTPPLDPLFVEPFFCSGDGLDPYHDMAVELIFLLSRNLDVDLKEKNTTGSWENSYWLRKGGATMALVQDDAFAHFAQFQDTDNALQGASMVKVAPMHYEYVHLVVNTGSIPGLDGPGFPTSGVNITLKPPGAAPGRRLAVTPYTPSASSATELRATVGDGHVTFRWVEPVSSTHARTEIWTDLGGMIPEQYHVMMDPSGTTIPVTNGRPTLFIFRTFDTGGGVIDVMFLFIPAAPVATEVDEITVEPGAGVVWLSWTLPADTTIQETEIWYDFSGQTRFLGPVASTERVLVYPNNHPIHIHQLFRDRGTTTPLEINVGPKTSGTFMSAMALIDSYRAFDSNDDGTPDLEEMTVHYNFDNPADAIDRVADGTYDAAFVTSGVPHQKLYAHDTYSLPSNVRILATQFHDRNGNGDYADDTPKPYRNGRLVGGGVSQFENYPYARAILPRDIPAVRVRALLTASPAFDDHAIEIFLRSILRKQYYMVNPADPDDPEFAPNPLWLPISVESFPIGGAPYSTFGEEITGVKEYFARNPFGWSRASAEFYLSLFPEEK